MSEDQRITKVEKEKDPRRVENGKRLALISKSAKEKKALQRVEERERAQQENSDSESYSIVTVITGVGVLTGLVCLYFTYKQDKRSQKQTVIHEKQHNNADNISEQKQSSNKLRSLDD